MKRLGALLLVLVLTLSVMPMGALATASNVFYGWNENVGFDALTASNADATSWTCVSISDNISPNNYKGVLVSGTGLASNMDITTGSEWADAGGGDTLIVNNDLVIASAGDHQYVTVSNLYTLGSSKVILNAGADSATLKTNNGAFTGTMTIARYAGGNSVADNPGTTPWSPGDSYVDTITVTATNGATITSYTQPAGSQFTVTGGNAQILSFTGVTTFNGKASFVNISTVTGEFTVGSTGVVEVSSATTFTSTITLYGKMNVTSDSNFQGKITVESGGILTVNNEGATGGATFTNIDVKTGGTLIVTKNAGANATFTNITVNGGTMNVTGPATFTDIEVNGGTVNISSESDFKGTVAINAGGTLSLNAPATFTTNPTIKGTLNIDATPNFESADITIDTAGVMNLGVNLTLGGSQNLIVNGGGTLKVKDTKTLNLGANSLTITGVADFGTGAKLTGDGTGTVTITGAMYMKDPAVQVVGANPIPSKFRGNGTIYTDHRTWFINGYADPNLKYVGYSPLTISYGESILVNTPVLAPASSNYSGYGDFIINTSGLFANFDPNESLYANNQKLQVGVDYEVNDKGGYAIFTIYESFMQSQSGPIVFRATFKNGYSGSTTVNVQSATIPAEIGVDAPKTGMSASTMGFVVIAMAVALAVVVRKVSVDS